MSFSAPSRRRRPPVLACRALSALAALAAAVVACSPPEPTEHAGHAVALDVDRERRTVTLDHGDIPGVMQAMTMTFDVAPGVDLESLEPDTPVDFTLRSQGQSLTVTEIRPTATP
jgi:Cu/Ag efflux protein CusF